ncbi:MAG: transposase [Prochloron sp. SP5CPC1]|nr:transposase [Candidatus Paraprochloron terpiosi SP5CPC1]
MKGRTPTSATLSKHRDGKLYIHIQIKDQVPDPQKSDDVIGVDLGRSDIAVTSEGESWSGQRITQVRDRFSRVRASVQRKGTKGAKRLLKRLSGREKRYQTARKGAKAQRDTITLRLRYSTVSFQLHPNCGIAPSPLIPNGHQRQNQHSTQKQDRTQTV